MGRLDEHVNVATTSTGTAMHLATAASVSTLICTLKPQSNNTVIGTLAVDGWAVTFNTARRGLGGLRSRPVSSSLYQL